QCLEFRRVLFRSCVYHDMSFYMSRLILQSRLYEYYASKDELIVDYMHELMKNYTTELSTITAHENAKNQLIQLIELMIKYAHIHNILKMIPLLQSKSQAVVAMKEQFVDDHLNIIQKIKSIIHHGKQRK